MTQSTNTKAPERISVDFNGNKTASVISDVPEILGTLEYIRADLAPQWQDIATAPKDSSTIYLGTTEGNQQAFWCENGKGYWANPINGTEIHGDAYKWLRDVQYGPTPPVPK